MFLLAVVCGPVAACATRGVPLDVPVVHDIDIRGESALSEREIKKKILTTEVSWWPFTDARPFDAMDWQTDLRRIQRFYESRGYYQARIVKAEVIPRPAEVGKQKMVDLVVELEEGQPVLVGSVDMPGLDPVEPKTQERLKSEWPLPRGEVFREEDWVAGQRILRRLLRDQGHATAEVDGHALVDVSKLAADLRLDLVPGPRYQFGSIELRTATSSRIPTGWIEEQVRLEVPPDAPFSDEALEEAQRRVFSMNVFSTARVTTGKPDPLSRHIPVVVEVREGPLRTLRLGGGLAIDQIRQEARFITQWTHRNFLGGLRRLSLRGEAGWAFIPTALAVARSLKTEGARSGPIFTLAGDFDQPRMFGRPSLRGKLSQETERTMEQTYDALGAKASAGVSWAPYSWLTVFPTYNFEGEWLSGHYSATAQSAPLALGCNTDPCLVLLSYLEQIATLDTRDNALEPRRGHYVSVSLQEGGGPLGGDFSYLRVLPEARTYYTFGPNLMTLATRLRVGTLVTRGGRPEDSAVTTRFFSGGSAGMRGFAIRRLAPLLLVDAPGLSGERDKLALPIGGNGLLEGSIEARMRFSENLMFAAFTDFGAVTRNRLPPIDKLPDLLWALGIGFRYLTPVGPLRLDLAFRLPVGKPPPLYNTDGREITYENTGGIHYGSESGDNVAGGCFGIGGHPDQSWVKDGYCAFHVSIGEAF
jgi:translocation and assembly module TamA